MRRSEQMSSPTASEPDLMSQDVHGQLTTVDAPERFTSSISEQDLQLLKAGRHLRPYEVLGAVQIVCDGIAGTRFALWAPNASCVRVVGDFNRWDADRHPMYLHRSCGVWELFLPGVGQGALYKFALRAANGDELPLRADPYALQSELRPASASVVAYLPPIVPVSDDRKVANACNAPISIYEVHVGSWRRQGEHGTDWLSWDELGTSLIPYALDMGFTHLELMPISEHPFDGSWGYQPVGLYAPTARFGDAAALQRFIAACHAAGLGVLLDWVPAHFPTDEHGLSHFDGTHLYDYADPREGFHQDWNTLIYKLDRAEVQNFLIGNSLYWLERFGFDGLRVDAVSSMLYRDYSRKEGEWIPNRQGGRENLESIAFFKQMHAVLSSERPQAITLAEESTAFPAVSHPTKSGGLGFNYKWNMGWMHDSLHYMARDPIHRPYHHEEITFSMVYAYSEHFVLPISHDEVVHGKGSMLNKMPGDSGQKFANLRAYYGYMFGHPGKKLLFMGCEFAQQREWHHDCSLDWQLLEQPKHLGMQNLVRDLNRLYRATPALYEEDFSPAGFGWIEHDNAELSLISFVRRCAQQSSLILVVCNFTPAVQTDYRIGVPQSGRWGECLNTDAAQYGGEDVGANGVSIQSEAVSWHGQPWSIVIQVAPLATIFFTWCPE